MGFERYIKRHGRVSGSDFSFSRNGTAVVSAIPNIKKYNSVEVNFDRHTTEIGLVFLERERLRFENDTFALYKKGSCCTVYINSALKELKIVLPSKVTLPYRTIEVGTNNMYIFDFSKYKQV
jgi:hypothetical protein